MQIKIIPNEKGNPPGMLAEAELHFGPLQGECPTCHHYGADCTCPLAGLKLIGFGIWERRSGTRSVTFPARTYNVSGTRRTFALLRPIVDVSAQDRIRQIILNAYADFEAQRAEAR